MTPRAGGRVEAAREARISDDAATAARSWRRDRDRAARAEALGVAFTDAEAYRRARTLHDLGGAIGGGRLAEAAEVLAEARRVDALALAHFAEVLASIPSEHGRDLVRALAEALDARETATQARDDLAEYDDAAQAALGGDGVHDGGEAVGARRGVLVSAYLAAREVAERAAASALGVRVPSPRDARPDVLGATARAAEARAVVAAYTATDGRTFHEAHADDRDGAGGRG